ncbi:hypothetical protein SPRG_02763 [Saprolegnia parasitica CBS 223.65]|uniref:Uncharacterized protein n=1 Tax=Saprolegnia parasitica (strain CBS 223.65) TaxID=695850 RepID=A0A067CNM8_SAPPC|nr:hypothetical protein SPRG_02763 [Saprolegnia parasitica CBS 223.65]KDO32284.1 hypothetical protein SPRG_02763 [Saprolegnia parasitica CBS 223.65]|eukprot:XP_012196740.1 hypothetical protein SPRG_02763 [Saprolegnia parasitica CBS 223.65]
MAAPAQRARGDDRGVLAPQVAETIAMLIPCAASCQRFVTALPASATTSALASLARLYAAPAVDVAWPNLVVRGPSLSSAASNDLAAIGALAPKSVIVSYKIKERSNLEVVAGIAPWITQMTFHLEGDAPDAATWAYYRTTLASCQRLETFVFLDDTAGYGALGGVFLELPRLTSLTLGVYCGYRGQRECHVTPDFTVRLTKWLQTRPVTHLAMDFLWLGLDPDSPRVLELCDAISSSTTLTTLKLNNVDIFENFLNGRPLPQHLKRLDWDVDDWEATNHTDAGWRNFVNALIDGPQLEHLGCKQFELLLEQDDVIEMLEGLSSLEAHCLGYDVASLMDLLDLLGNMSDVKQLEFKCANFEGDAPRVLFAAALSRPRLETFGMSMALLLAEEVRVFFQAVPQLPHRSLKHVDFSHHHLTVADVLAMLPTLNAATQYLETVQLQGSWHTDELAALATAVGQLPDRHFAVVPSARLATPAFFAQWRDYVHMVGSPLCLLCI